MRGINRVILIGNCGKDAETRYSQEGTAITNVTLATSESWKDKATGEQVEKTEWHRVVFFGKLGEIAGEYLKKGSQVYVEGALRTRKWTNQEGKDQYTTEIVGNEMQMLGGGSHDNLPDEARRPPRQRSEQPQQASAFDSLSDDIPF